MTTPLPAADPLTAARAALARDDLAVAGTILRERLRADRDDPAALDGWAECGLRQGRLDAACWALARIAHRRPEDGAALDRLGQACLQARNTRAALAAFSAAQALDPRDALACNGIGLCHLLDDQPAAALEPLARAAAADPRDASILVNGAQARQRAGDLPGAVVWIERAAKLAPKATTLVHASLLREAGDCARAWTLLGLLGAEERAQPQVQLEAVRCLRELGRVDAALDLLAGFDRQWPQTADFHEQMGHCLAAPEQAAQRHAHWCHAVELLFGQRRLRRARSLLEHLLGQAPHLARGWLLRGMLELAVADDAQAEAALRQALACDGGLLGARWRLASLLEQGNRIEPARAVLAQTPTPPTPDAVASDDDCTQWHLVDCRLALREGRPEAALAIAAALMQHPLDEPSRLRLQFERGRALDRLDRVAEAMAAFAAGNAWARQAWQRQNPGPNPFLAEVDACLAHARHGGLDRWPALAPSAPDGEPDPIFVVGFPRSGTTLVEQALAGNSHLQVLMEAATAVRMRDIVAAMPDGYPQAIGALDEFDRRYLRTAYFDAVAGACTRDRQRLLVDKMPLQMTRAALIARVFPRARWVFLARHPADACLSCFMQNFAPNPAMANFHTLADTVQLYVRTMALWELYRERLGLVVHTVHYHRLVTDFDGQMAALCAFLGVPVEADQARFAERARSGRRIATPSYEQVSQPLHRGAIDRWQRYRTWLEPYLPRLQPFIDRYAG